ncbi:hypothetical protein [Aestuariivirga sp.]|uniref:hypothetical protein n=1 Tax=Aestuariivirga sp. TaxID=2650926 RepID=UPI003593F0B0
MQETAKQTLTSIRDLLDTLEVEIASGATQQQSLVAGFELPDIIRDVVDLLVPEIRPYEATFYLYMLRHSVVETGTQLVRVSRRGLADVVKSPASRGGNGSESGKASYETARLTLEGLEAIGAIRREAVRQFIGVGLAIAGEQALALSPCA